MQRGACDVWTFGLELAESHLQLFLSLQRFVQTRLIRLRFRMVSASRTPTAALHLMNLKLALAMRLQDYERRTTQFSANFMFAELVPDHML